MDIAENEVVENVNPEKKDDVTVDFADGEQNDLPADGH